MLNFVKAFLAILKDREGLCALAFLLALFAVFEGAIVHGIEALKLAGVFGNTTITEAHAESHKEK